MVTNTAKQAIARRWEKIPFTLMVITLTAIFALSAAGQAYAAPKEPPVKIALLDRNEVFGKHPEAQKAVAEILAERNRLQGEYNEQSKNLGEQEKRALSTALSNQAAAKEAELLKPIREDIEKAIDAVMKEGGYTHVLEKNTVIRGGTDITEEVVKKFGAPGEEKRE